MSSLEKSQTDERYDDDVRTRGVGQPGSGEEGEKPWKVTLISYGRQEDETGFDPAVGDGLLARGVGQPGSGEEGEKPWKIVSYFPQYIPSDMSVEQKTDTDEEVLLARGVGQPGSGEEGEKPWRVTEMFFTQNTPDSSTTSEDVISESELRPRSGTGAAYGSSARTHVVYHFAEKR